jgi:hypothetical protein
MLSKASTAIDGLSGNEGYGLVETGDGGLSARGQLACCHSISKHTHRPCDVLEFLITKISEAFT